MRYYYVVLHSALSVPFCFVFLYFYSLNLRYYFATSTRSGRSTKKFNLYNKSKYKSEILKKFHFECIKFLMMNSVDNVSKHYQVPKKYLKIMFKISNYLTGFFYPL